MLPLTNDSYISLETPSPTAEKSHLRRNWNSSESEAAERINENRAAITLAAAVANDI